METIPENPSIPTAATSTAFTLLEVISVTATAMAEAYIVRCVVDHFEGQQTWDYMSYADDPYGLNPTIRQWLFDHAGEYTILPYVAPPPLPPQPYIFQIGTMWDRMTDDEAETFDTASATASPLKMRKQYQVATAMMSDGELFAWVKALLAGLFGEARATELLAA